MKRYILLVLLLILNVFSSLIVVANGDIQKPIITNMSTANMQILKESTISFDVYDLQTRVLKSSIEVYINNQKHTNLTFINIDKGFNVTIKGLKNFILSGQWILRSGGLPPAAITGKWAAQRICKKDKVKFKMS